MDRVEQVKNLAIEGLPEMFDPQEGLFCFRSKRTAQGIVRQGTSYRYTLISLLGLSKLEETGVKTAVNIEATLKDLLKRSDQIGNVGDLGLLLWTCALVLPGRIPDLCREFDVATALNNYPDARKRKTMELSWFLAGLAHGSLVSTRISQTLIKDVAHETYKLLKGNYGGLGIFGHLHRDSFSGRLRSRIGSFADQVYPIYALTKYAQSYKNDEAIGIASECAEKICEHQGSLGRWWWHYDAVTGEVAGRYPVYSVHQDGMAPMALLQLEEATGKSHRQSVMKGLSWVSGKNELSHQMIGNSANIIWRSIHPRRFKRICEELSFFMRNGTFKDFDRELLIRFECRPYHLGWVLYALCRN